MIKIIGIAALLVLSVSAGSVGHAQDALSKYEGVNTTRDIWIKQMHIDGYDDLTEKQLDCMAWATMTPAPTAANRAADTLAEIHTQAALDKFLIEKAAYFAAYEADKGRDPFDYGRVLCTHS